MAEGKKPRHLEDAVRYEELLEASRDEEGICHRNDAVKLLTEELTTKTTRVAEFAEARAVQVADGFDSSHSPEITQGQTAFGIDINTYLVIGDSERITVDRAMSKHTRQWLEVQAAAHARIAQAWATKNIYGRKLLKVQDEQTCSMWKAEQILRGEKS
jgi:hypothetical protein